MKKLGLIIILLVSILIVNAQSDIFILIDVSGNPLNSSNKISSIERTQAINLCKQLIEGNVNNAEYTSWEPKSLDGFIKQSYSNNGKSILNTINSITVIPYGDMDTYKRFKIFQNRNATTTLTQAVNFASNFNYSDQLTFGKLARAKAADIAIDANIKQYYLFEISGLGGDQTGSKSINKKQQVLIDKYESSAIIEPIGLFRLKNKPFSITAKVVNVKKLGLGNNTSGSKGIIGINNVNNKTLKLINPIGTKSKYTSLKQEDGLTVSWNCLACNTNTKFSVKAYNIKTKKTKTQTCNGCNSIKMDLDDGVYKISIKGKDTPSCQNNNQYVEIEGESSSGAFFFILFLLIIAGLVYYLKTKDPLGWWDKDKKKIKTDDDDLDSLY